MFRVSPEIESRHRGAAAINGMNVQRAAVSLFLFASLAVACERTPAPPQVVSPSPTRQLSLVDKADQVCMVNNQFMGRPQIPVEVEGRTYFGCCAMCKSRLAQDRAARVAIDPFSGREVDKSSAVIAQDQAGAVVYFENEASFASYQAAGS